MTALPRQYTQEDLQRAAPRVLERLRQMAELPGYGTVAGQAVASLFWEELGHPARGPINDIDVFVNLNLPRHLRGMEELPPNPAPASQVYRSQGTVHHFNDVQVEDEHRYNHIKFIALRSTTSILRTYRVGLVNYTLTSSALNKPDAWGHDQAVSQVLVDGFDLNLVSVGINLETGQAVASPGFMEFLNHNRIQVQTCNTPAHTMIRLARKCFGGQIQGSSCDYARERALLELALACHANPNPGTYSAPLAFGTRYKQDYDRFAEHLPGIESVKPNTFSDSGYTFYGLSVPAPTAGPDLALFSLGGAETRFEHTLLRLVFVNHFPQIYSLYYPDRSSLAPEELALRRQAFEQLDPGKDECHNLSCLQRALGRPTVDVKLEGMDEPEMFVFFFDQDCAKDPTLVQEVVATWDALPAMDRAVIRSLHLRADRVLEFQHDRKHAWRGLLDEFGQAAVLSTITLPPALAHAAQSQLLDWIQEMGAAASGLLSQLVPAHHMGATGSTLGNLLEALDPQLRPQIAHRLMELAIPAWPALAGVDPKTRAGAMTLWATATDEPLPEDLWEHITDQEIPALLEVLAGALRYMRLSSPLHQAKLEDTLNRLVPRLDQEQWLDHNARMVRLLLCVDAFPMSRSSWDQATMAKLQDSLLAGHPTCKSWGALVQDLRQSPAAYTLPVPGGSEEQFEDLWRQVINPQLAAADIETALLEGQALGSSPTRRGPRL